MEVKQDLGRRRLSRRSEPNRLEDEVWALAYEEIWPLFGKVVRKRNPPQDDSTAPSITAVTGARSA